MRGVRDNIFLGGEDGAIDFDSCDGWVLDRDMVHFVGWAEVVEGEDMKKDYFGLYVTRPLPATWDTTGGKQWVFLF